MNRDCYGDWLPAIGMYRCLMDGKFIPRKTQPKTCPNCHRLALPRVTKAKPRFRVVKQHQIFLGSFGWVNYNKATKEAATCPSR